MKFMKNLFGDSPKNSANHFADLDLPLELEQAIDELGFIDCTPVQKEVLPQSIDGLDIIAQAQTGTGKTAAFLISMLTYHIENPELSVRGSGTPFALIIAPTRELVMQIADEAKKLSAYTDISITPIVGGIDYEKQKQLMQSHVDIIVATPGRLLDFCRSNIINLSRVESLVIDEADRMLSMGFIPDVKSIIRRTPNKDRRQTQLFSATLSEDIQRLAKAWTLNPFQVHIKPEQIAVGSVTQLVYLIAEREKFRVLFNLLKSVEVTKAIIFVNRRDQTRSLEENLHRYKISTGLLTGEVPQKRRIRTLQKFKAGKIKVLVATDVAGRGIHVDDVSHVINFNLPEDPEDYVHRIGRTGRAGAKGTSISLVCESDVFMLPAIEKLLGESIISMQPEEKYLSALPNAILPRKNNSS